MKKLILPSVMAVMAALSIAVIVLSLNTKTPVTLQMLRIDDGLDVKSYNLEGGDTINLATGVEKVTVDARATDGAAKVVIKGDGSESPLVEGKNILSITVFGSDGKSQKEYTMFLVVPKLEGWCQENADEIKIIEGAWQEEVIYGLPGYAELGSKAAEIKAHLNCFSDSLQKEITTNY